MYTALTHTGGLAAVWQKPVRLVDPRVGSYRTGCLRNCDTCADLQLSESVLDDVVSHASDQVKVEEVVKLAGAALADGARLYFGHIHIPQCKHAERLEQLPRPRNL